MHGLGQPCALHALFPPGLLRAVAKSVALREAAGRSSLRAAVWLLSSQVQPRPAAGEQAARSRDPPPVAFWRGGRTPPLPLGFWPGCKGAKQLCLLLFPLRQPRGEAAGPHRLRTDAALRATGSDLPAGGGRSSLGSQKDISRSPENKAPDPSKENGKKSNKSQQLKKVFKEYGAVAVGFHVGISLMSLGMFYLAVSSGVDMTALLFKLGFDEALVQSKLAAGTSTFVLAYAIHKLFAPVRISITLVSVPFLVRYFRKTGIFKPPAPNP
ncbi:protein FAM210B, mitochondrial [Eublepharis macularius]|uniref:Protein FAM210B, mitochondrial n=1 Tax=Eublepharis macularius TaxID=481883 RepID=A0AA97L0Z5_EUBMA|nr:protein FAM210B, mitochondrial [Eublepharis macularius]